MKNRRTSLGLSFTLVVLSLPYLINQSPQGINPQDLPQASYVALNPHWEYAGEINAIPISRLAAAVVWPAPAEDRGRVLAFDSTGTVLEFDYVEGTWQKLGSFSLGVPMSAACAGMPQHDRNWRVYAGSPNGQITEITKTSMGWTTMPVTKLDHGITALYASDPGFGGVSQMFAIDASGHVTNFWIGMNQNWVLRDVPDIDGGATDLCLNQSARGLEVMTAGPKGELHKYAQDTLTGHWTGFLWASMPAGVLDMAASVDPTMSDMALYYSGLDGIFRYLFHEHKTDEIARVPIAAGAKNLIGKQSELRYNEFFAISGNEYCQFEFSSSSREWERIPLKQVSEPVVSVDFRCARAWPRAQVIVATAGGHIHEFTRLPSEGESPGQ